MSSKRKLKKTKKALSKILAEHQFDEAPRKPCGVALLGITKIAGSGYINENSGKKEKLNFSI